MCNVFTYIDKQTLVKGFTNAMYIKCKNVLFRLTLCYCTYIITNLDTWNMFAGLLLCLSCVLLPSWPESLKKTILTSTRFNWINKRYKNDRLQLLPRDRNMFVAQDDLISLMMDTYDMYFTYYRLFIAFKYRQ